MQLSRADAIVDVEGDHEQEALRLLFERGLRPPRRDEARLCAELAIANILEHQHRIPSARPRQVQVSERFRNEVPELAERFKKGIESLLADAEKGAPLRPYLSTMVNGIPKVDGLLNDWLVHHFHLGAPALQPNGFVQRTGPLLFVTRSLVSKYSSR